MTARDPARISVLRLICTQVQVPFNGFSGPPYPLNPESLMRGAGIISW
jgi:hypothetical protein